MPSVGDGRRDLSQMHARQRHSLHQKMEMAMVSGEIDKARKYAYHLKKFGKRKSIS